MILSAPESQEILIITEFLRCMIMNYNVQNNMIMIILRDNNNNNNKDNAQLS